MSRVPLRAVRASGGNTNSDMQKPNDTSMNILIWALHIMNISIAILGSVISDMQKLNEHLGAHSYMLLLLLLILTSIMYYVLLLLLLSLQY